MADFDVEEIKMVSDLSESYGTGDDGSHVGGSSSEPLRGVRNCGVPPFVSKLYSIVCDTDYDSIISWVSLSNFVRMENQVHNGATSFAIWNDTEFINKVLPLISRSNNFDSFISQLNNYGFKKVSWDRREYANEWFLEGKPHLLKNMKNKSSKRRMEMNEKMSREIQKLENESREIDYEFNAFKEYVDNTMSNQKKILQVMTKAIKTILDNHKDVYTVQEVETSDNGTRILELTGQQVHEENLVGDSSFAPS